MMSTLRPIALKLREVYGDAFDVLSIGSYPGGPGDGSGQAGANDLPLRILRPWSLRMPRASASALGTARAMGQQVESPTRSMTCREVLGLSAAGHDGRVHAPAVGHDVSRWSSVTRILW